MFLSIRIEVAAFHQHVGVSTARKGRPQLGLDDILVPAFRNFADAAPAYEIAAQ